MSDQATPTVSLDDLLAMVDGVLERRRAEASPAGQPEPKHWLLLDPDPGSGSVAQALGIRVSDLVPDNTMLMLPSDSSGLRERAVGMIKNVKA